MLKKNVPLNSSNICFVFFYLGAIGGGFAIFETDPCNEPWGAWAYFPIFLGTKAPLQPNGHKGTAGYNEHCWSL